MSGLDLAKKVGLRYSLNECKNSPPNPVECSLQELEETLRKNFQDKRGVFVAWQIQSIVWGKFDGEKLLLKENLQPNFNDWLECRIFNEQEEFHLKRSGKNFVGRYIRDEAGAGKFYVDSFARLWGERDKNFSTDGWIKLEDKPRKISMEIPCDDGNKKYYGLLTRNYIGSDDATGLSGYVDYRFVAIESAWGGD